MRTRAIFQETEARRDKSRQRTIVWVCGALLIGLTTAVAVMARLMFQQSNEIQSLRRDAATLEMEQFATLICLTDQLAMLTGHADAKDGTLALDQKGILTIMRGTILGHARILLLESKRIDRDSFDRLKNDLQKQGDVNEWNRGSIHQR